MQVIVSYRGTCPLILFKTQKNFQKWLDRLSEPCSTDGIRDTPNFTQDKFRVSLISVAAFNRETVQRKSLLYYNHYYPWFEKILWSAGKMISSNIIPLLIFSFTSVLTDVVIPCSSRCPISGLLIEVAQNELHPTQKGFNSLDIWLWIHSGNLILFWMHRCVKSMAQ